jgi:hypothetical protein
VGILNRSFPLNKEILNLSPKALYQGDIFFGGDNASKKRIHMGAAVICRGAGTIGHAARI